MQSIPSMCDRFPLPVQILQYTHSQLLKQQNKQHHVQLVVSVRDLYQDHQDDILFSIWRDLSRFWSAD